jgi:branched-chain amino acid transport system substrate-binding protein
VRQTTKLGIRILAVAVAVVVLAGACGGEDREGQAGGKGTVTVGAALSLTGKLAREGILTREGYDYCAEVVNEKGGVPLGEGAVRLALEYQDDQSTPDVASRLVDQMHSQGIDLLLGPYGSASTEAAAATVEKNGQVMVEGAGADDKIFTKGYRNTFAVLSPASQYLTSIIQAVAELARPKPATVAIVSADDGFSRTGAEAGKAEAERQGMQVVALEYVPNGTTDVSAALTKIRPRRPDLLLGSVHLQEGIAIVKQSQELGLNPAGGFGETVAPPTPDFVKNLGKGAEYVLGSSQWTPETGGRDDWFGTAADYAAGFRARYGRDPEYHNAEASAACLALVLATRDARSLEAGKVRDALDRLDADSFFGPLSFDPTGKNTAKPMSVIQIQDGRAVTIWPTSPGAKPLRWPTVPFDKR